jgi:4-oxalocrotonate tautomerase
MFEGRSLEQKRALVAALTDACVRTLGSAPDSVSVLLFDVPKHDWARAGVLMSERDAAPKPADG